MVLPSPRTYNWVSCSQMLTPETDLEKTVDVIIEGNTYFDPSNPHILLLSMEKYMKMMLSRNIFYLKKHIIQI